MEARRPQALELGLFALVVALPLAFTPFTTEPFGDPKLVLLALGALMLWLAGASHDKRLAGAVGALVLASAAAAVFGVDPLRSLTDDASGNGFGLIPLACSAYLVVCGVSLSAKDADRVRRWLAWTGVVVAALLVTRRFLPSQLGEVGGAGFIGATLGNELFAGAFVAAAMPGVALDDSRARRARFAMLAVMALGLGIAGERSSYLLPVVALAAAGWRGRGGARTTIVAIVWVVAFTLAAGPLTSLAPDEGRTEGTGVTQFGSAGTDVGRFTVWRVVRRGFSERPLLGWGPDETKSAYIHAATPGDLETATRRWADAHNIVLEVAVTSGVVGLAAFLLLAFGTLRRAFRAPPRLGWAFGAAASLAAYHAFEPLNLVLTPLLFLLAGIAGSSLEGRDRAAAGGGIRRPRRTTGTLLAVALAVSLVLFTASALEHWGDTYGEPWAYRAALKIEPWRLSAAEDLAIRLATDGRAGDEDASAEARSVIGDAVADHPWDPDVRTRAADVELLLKDPEAARQWIQRQIDRFPADIAALDELERGTESDA